MSKIYTLGPDGSYSSKATKIINKDFLFEIDYKKSVSDVIYETIESYYGVVPIYNNYGGIVESSIPLLIGNKNILNVCGITGININHCLATKNGDLNIEDISKIYSHPQAIKQCIPFLNENLLETVESQSTTEKINDINESEAIICSIEAAKKNNLNILNTNIAPKDNVTNFAFIANNDYLNDEIIYSVNCINKDMFSGIELLDHFMNSKIIKNIEQIKQYKKFRY